MRGEISERDDAIGTRNTDSPIHDLQIACRSFQSVGGNLLDLLGELLRRAIDRNSTDGNRTRPTSAGATLDLVGITLDDPHTLRRQIKTLGN